MNNDPAQTTHHNAGRIAHHLLLTLLLSLVCARAAIFMFFPHAHFDSDQAVFGLMGKDIAAGRNFPLFMYGQRYMLAFGSWLCAPLFALFGAGPFTLKLPMLGFNLGIVALLWWLLKREVGVGAVGAFLACLPFALPSVVSASRLIEHQGGNVEPFFFILLGYLARDRAVALGLVFGAGFLNREFSLIGFIALLLLDVLQGSLLKRWRVYAIAGFIIVALSVSVRAIAALSPDYYGTAAQLSLVGLRKLAGLRGYLSVQLPAMLGGAPRALRDYNIASTLSTGHRWVLLLFSAWCAGFAVYCAPKLRRPDLLGLPPYLALVGFGQAAAYVLFCPGPFEIMLVRYALLSFIGISGLIAMAWKASRMRVATAFMVFGLTLANAADHVRLISEYATRQPFHENETLANELLARNIRYAVSEYWVSYDVSWLTDERIIVAPYRGQAERMRRYRETVKAHWNEAVDISATPCTGGVPVVRWYLCKPRDVL